MQAMAFAEATRPRPRRILRVRLHDYSLGHEILFYRTNSPFLSEEFETLPDSVKREAIIQAVSICSRTWEENKKPECWLRLWLWLIRNDNFDHAIQEFIQYRAEGSSCPALKQIPHVDEARTLGAPFHARLLTFAAPLFGPTVFDQPFGMLVWMYFAQLESDERVQVKSDVDFQKERELAEWEAEMLKKRGLS